MCSAFGILRHVQADSNSASAGVADASLPTGVDGLSSGPAASGWGRPWPPAYRQTMLPSISACWRPLQGPAMCWDGFTTLRCWQFTAGAGAADRPLPGAFVRPTSVGPAESPTSRTGSTAAGIAVGSCRQRPLFVVACTVVAADHPSSASTRQHVLLARPTHMAFALFFGRHHLLPLAAGAAPPRRPGATPSQQRDTPRDPACAGGSPASCIFAAAPPIFMPLLVVRPSPVGGGGSPIVDSAARSIRSPYCALLGLRGRPRSCRRDAVRSYAPLLRRSSAANGLGWVRPDRIGGAPEAPTLAARASVAAGVFAAASICRSTVWCRFINSQSSILGRLFPAVAGWHRAELRHHRARVTAPPRWPARASPS